MAGGGGEGGIIPDRTGICFPARNPARTCTLYVRTYMELRSLPVRKNLSSRKFYVRTYVHIPAWKKRKAGTLSRIRICNSVVN